MLRQPWRDIAESLSHRRSCPVSSTSSASAKLDLPLQMRLPHAPAPPEPGSTAPPPQSRPPGHLQYRGGQPQLPHRLGQPVVVREHDHLPVSGRLLQRSRQPVHLRRVHRLNRIIDHQESERAGRRNRTS
jgi:hypothetical protein